MPAAIVLTTPCLCTCPLGLAARMIRRPIHIGTAAQRTTRPACLPAQRSSTLQRPTPGVGPAGWWQPPHDLAQLMCQWTTQVQAWHQPQPSLACLPVAAAGGTLPPGTGPCKEGDPVIASVGAAPARSSAQAGPCPLRAALLTLHLSPSLSAAASHRHLHILCLPGGRVVRSPAAPPPSHCAAPYNVLFFRFVCHSSEFFH